MAWWRMANIHDLCWGNHKFPTIVRQQRIWREPQLWHKRNQASSVLCLQHLETPWANSRVSPPHTSQQKSKPMLPSWTCMRYSTIPKRKKKKDEIVYNFPPYLENAFEKLPLKSPMTCRKARKIHNMPWKVLLSGKLPTKLHVHGLKLN